MPDVDRVQAANAEITQAAVKAAKEYDLTAAELIDILITLVHTAIYEVIEDECEAEEAKGILMRKSNCAPCGCLSPKGPLEVQAGARDIIE